MFFLGVCGGSLILGLMLGYIYGKMLADKGDPGAEAGLRNSAINTTVIVALAVLMLLPGSGAPWYKQAPVKGLYSFISTNLKPRDSKGKGWLAPQVYDKKEAKFAVWMYGLIHKALTAAICAGMVGGLAALACIPMAKSLGGGGGGGYVPPGPGRRPF
ncbi:hypothetical protein JST97_00605 [bacterium]|nr:hypothetical protein [bacterium]